MNRQEKQTEIEFLRDGFSRSQIALCADYLGLTVAEVTDLRRRLRGAGLQARVVKNTLAKLAAGEVFKDGESGQLEKFYELFTGPSMVIFSEKDPVAPAKIAAEFSKAHAHFKVKGAWFESKCMGEGDVKTLSAMPGREQLLSQLLSLLNTPATSLLRLVSAPATQIVRALDAYREKLEGK